MLFAEFDKAYDGLLRRRTGTHPRLPPASSAAGANAWAAGIEGLAGCKKEGTAQTRVRWKVEPPRWEAPPSGPHNTRQEGYLSVNCRIKLGPVLS